MSAITKIGGGFLVLCGGLAGIVVIATATGHLKSDSSPSAPSVDISEPDINDAADSVVQGLIKSPATYQRDSAEVVWTGKDQKGHPAKIVKVTFDAENGFGALLRSCQYVAFWFDGTKVMFHPQGAELDCDSLDGAPDVQAQTVSTLVSLNFSPPTPGD